MAKKKLTIKDMFELKGKRVLTEVHPFNEEECRACEEAGIDMLVVENTIEMVLRGAPNTFIIAGAMGSEVAQSNANAIRIAMDRMDRGADMIYTGQSLDRVRAMANEGIPVCGHVGLVPYRNSWYGGMKAVGKTADEALKVYKDVLAYQEAGAVAVEMEVVPEKIAAEITKRSEIVIVGLGSGRYCDVQYLFACDMLNINDGHIPRHAKIYADLRPEMEIMQQKRIEAFSAYQDEVTTGQFPVAPKNTVGVEDREFDTFMSQIDKI